MTSERFRDIRLVERPEGTLIDVKVVPGSSRDRVAGVLGARLKLTVSRPPEKGAANRAAAALLARVLGLKTGDVELTGGAGRAEKTFLARGLDPGQVRRCLESA